MNVVKDALAVTIILAFTALLFLPKIIHAAIAGAKAMGAS